MKESNTIANIVAMKELQREVLLITRRQCMMESNTLVNIAAMKESITSANFVAMKQLLRYHLPDTKKAVHK